MTHEEAIDRIKTIADSSRNVDQIGMFPPKPITVALEMAICALEKQIPMKPSRKTIGYFSEYVIEICPACKAELWDTFSGCRFCPECGQALCWEE